jgi:selenocysteine lyase/cysteine desulfurase
MNSEIRSLFPATEELVYLNSAAVAPLPSVSVSAVESQLKDVSLHGSMNYSKWVETKERCRVLVAELLNVEKENVAFLRNTSDGFAAVANGIDWKAGDNIVSFAGEFPSNFYPWRMVRDRFGVELRLCGERDGRVDIEKMLAMVDERTKIISISAIQFSTGFRADLERIGEVARKYNALFSVDIIQAFGAIPLNLSALGVDIAAGASHKWLCAPEGCGILYLSARAQERISPSLVGWISVPDPWNFGDRDRPLHPNALSLESGTGPAALFYGLEQSLMLLKNVGIEKIKEHNFNLSELICEKLTISNFNVVSVRDASSKSQIVSIKHKHGITAPEIFKSLQSQGVVVSSRGDKLRIAPHFFNIESDIVFLAELLKKF